MNTQGKIYLIQENKSLQPLSQQPYITEDELQRFLEDYHDLLAGDQIDEQKPRRWLLISREMGIPDSDTGLDRWMLDHLFLDQDGIPTLVEVKRSSDTRIRRSVVGQMLDYAANAVLYWPVERIIEQFRAKDPKTDINELVANLIGAEVANPEAINSFWERVKTNLQAGKIRLLFVADEIPPELRRIVEFLNAQMSEAEVLAVEIKQYVGGGVRTLVPRVYGQTAASDRKKIINSIEPRKWDRPSFIEELKQRFGPEVMARGEKLLTWAEGKKINRIEWGKGAQIGRFTPIFKYHNREYKPFAVYTDGSIELYFPYYGPPFDQAEQRLALLQRLNAIPNLALSEDAIEQRFSIWLSSFQTDQAVQQFLDVFDWFIQRVQQG